LLLWLSWFPPSLQFFDLGLGSLQLLLKLGLFLLHRLVEVSFCSLQLLLELGPFPLQLLLEVSFCLLQLLLELGSFLLQLSCPFLCLHNLILADMPTPPDLGT
jgi:hypothetical protein